MKYPIVIHKDRDSDYGVTVPDLPGCFSAGSTLEEAMTMAAEAIALHLEGLVEEGHEIPDPQPIEKHRRNPDYRGAFWALVDVPPETLRNHVKRVNVTIPQRVLDALDRAAAARHDTRSGLLTKAATNYLKTTPKSRKSRRVWRTP